MLKLLIAKIFDKIGNISFNNPYVIVEKDTIKKMAKLNMWIDHGIDFYSPWHFKKLMDKFEYEEVNEEDDIN